MAKFAPVCPPRVLRQLSPGNSGNYHLLLAHDVAAHIEEYAWQDNFRGMQVIMDNSVIELGGAVDLDTIMTACSVVDVTSVVLPDVLLDGNATVESCTAALADWTPFFKKYFNRIGPWKRGFMYVPQGKTLAEFAWAAQKLCDHPGINFWGIPRNLVGQVGTRRDAIDVCHALNRHRSIHLLGFSDNICDDVICARDTRVSGIDSAVPLRVKDEFTFKSDPGPRGDWWDTVEYNPQMDRNIEIYQSWIRR